MAVSRIQAGRRKTGRRGDLRQGLGEHPETSKEPQPPARRRPANGDPSVIPEPNGSRPLSGPCRRGFLGKQRESKGISQTVTSAGQRWPERHLGKDVGLPVRKVATGPSLVPSSCVDPI